MIRIQIKKRFYLPLVIGLLGLAGCASPPVNLSKLPRQDQATVIRILAKLDPVIVQRRKAETIAALAFEDLYAPLDSTDRAFLRRIQSIDVNELDLTIPHQGIHQTPPELVALEGQIMTTPSGPQQIPTQYLPKPVYEAYLAMSAAMKADIGKTVYVESGYRSAAYQFYLFLFYLQNHNYSIQETARFVAWPGYSEHGNPTHQAIDLVNEQGIDGQNNPAEFEALPEYPWLLKNAARYGFELSYPKGSKMAFEPWHWRYQPKKCPKKEGFGTKKPCF